MWGRSEEVARPTGDSPRRRSAIKNRDNKEGGAPDRIRTCDPCLRRAILYPAELRARWCFGYCSPGRGPTGRNPGLRGGLAWHCTIPGYGLRPNPGYATGALVLRMVQFSASRPGASCFDAHCRFTIPGYATYRPKAEINAKPRNRAGQYFTEIENIDASPNQSLKRKIAAAAAVKPIATAASPATFCSGRTKNAPMPRTQMPRPCHQNMVAPHYCWPHLAALAVL